MPWPEVVRPRLDGTTHVRPGDLGSTVHVDGEVVFGNGTGPLELCDAHGHPLAVDKAGHLREHVGIPTSATAACTAPCAPAG